METNRFLFCCRSRRKESVKSTKPSSAMEKSPDWLELPPELMANILHRLGPKEIINSARKVCKTWWGICNDPAMWKVLDMHVSFTLTDNDDLETLTRQAVDLSCGELMEISIKGFGTDDLLEYIVLRSNKLKRLCLVNCMDITHIGLNRAVRRVPQLEELWLNLISINAADIVVIGQNCPQLKSLMMMPMYTNTFIKSDDHAFAIANNMPELCHLKLVDIKMTNEGLQAILNSCPHLQSLDVRGCYKLNLGGSLGKQCMERIKDFKAQVNRR